MTSESLDAAGVIEELSKSRERGRFALAFDADGTLWSGDVGEDTFGYATSRGLLTDAPRSSLKIIADAHGLGTEGTSSEIAASIFAAYLRGEVDEKLTCEVMTWAYAGHSEEELKRIALEAFEARDLRARVRTILFPVLEWARKEGGFVMVISASPRIVVEAALAHTGIESDFLLAGMAAAVDGRILPRMDGALPYGPAKRTEGERVLRHRGDTLWLGSFGDNGFDTDMLRAARVGVAVCPKPALVRQLPLLPNTVVLC